MLLALLLFILQHGGIMCLWWRSFLQLVLILMQGCDITVIICQFHSLKHNYYHLLEYFLKRRMLYNFSELEILYFLQKKINLYICLGVSYNWEFLKQLFLFQDGESGWSSLHRALHFGHLSIASVLLQAGASLTLEDSKCRTPIDLISGPVSLAVGNVFGSGTCFLQKYNN